MVEYLSIIQVRLSSTRLPCKALLDLGGKTLLQRVIDAVLSLSYHGQVCVATSNCYEDEIIKAIVERNYSHVEVYCGSLTNVLSRFVSVANSSSAEHIVRYTADNPILDALGIEKLLQIYSDRNLSYATFKTAYGSAAEVFTKKALMHENNLNKVSSCKKREEHVTYYMRQNIPELFVQHEYEGLRTTIDTPSDYITSEKFYLHCAVSNQEPTLATYKEWMGSGNGIFPC